MPVKAGQIVIDVTAGSAKFAIDMEKINGQIRQMGTSGGQAMAPMNIALRELGGNFENNTRGVARFLTQTVGLGPVVAAAFPLIGGLAFGGMLAKLGTEVYDFFKKMEEAPARIRNAFREINAPLQQTNDEAQVSLDKMENRLAILEGHRPNTLKLMLDENVVSADKLSSSLDKDLGKISEMLTKAQTGTMGTIWDALTSRYMFGGSTDDQFTGDAKLNSLKKSIGGETGAGGFRGEISKLAASFDRMTADAARSGDSKAQESAQDHKTSALIELMTKKRDVLDTALSKETDDRVKEALQGYSAGLTGAIASLSIQHRAYLVNNHLTEEEAAQEASRNAPPDYMAKIRREQQAGLSEKTLDSSKIGEPEWLQVLMDARKKSVEIVRRTNEEITGYNKSHPNNQQPLVTAAQQKEIEEGEKRIVGVDAEAKLKSQFQALEDLQYKLRADTTTAYSTGQGYPAQRQAFIDSRMTEELRKNGDDPEFMNDPSHQEMLGNMQADLGQEYDINRRNKSVVAVRGLQNQIDLENSLANVQQYGAEMVRKVTEAYQRRAMSGKGDTEEQIKAQEELTASQRANVSAANIAGITQKTAAIEHLNAAIFQGAEAQRVAGLENKYGEMAFQGKTPAEVNAQRLQDEAEHQQQITEEAGKLVTAYGDEMKKLSDITAELLKQKAAGGDLVQINIALRDLDDQRLRLAAQQAEKLRTASAGVRAFFLDMQTQAKSAATIIHESLNSAVEGVSGELAKLMTGQKTSFGKMFQQQGEEVLHSTLHSAMQTGLGALGKKFGINAKADGSDANPFYVIVKNTPSGNAMENQGLKPGVIPMPNLSGVGGAVSGVARSIGNIIRSFGHMTESVSSTFTPMAGGGDVDPGRSYWVGENGPEPFVPRTAGSIISRKDLGGETHYHTWNIDARNADIGVANRLEQVMNGVHDSAVVTAIRANAEMAKRRPRAA